MKKIVLNCLRQFMYDKVVLKNTQQFTQTT